MDCCDLTIYHDIRENAFFATWPEKLSLPKNVLLTLPQAWWGLHVCQSLVIRENTTWLEELPNCSDCIRSRWHCRILATLLKTSWWCCWWSHLYALKPAIVLNMPNGVLLFLLLLLLVVDICRGCKQGSLVQSSISSTESVDLSRNTVSSHMVFGALDGWCCQCDKFLDCKQYSQHHIVVRWNASFYQQAQWQYSERVNRSDPKIGSTLFLNSLLAEQLVAG